MAVLIVLLCIVILILLISWAKFNPFLAFLVVSIIAALLLGIPLQQISISIQKGIGDILSSLVIVIATGAMLGKLIAQSGAAQKIATVMMQLAGRKHILWALLVTGFIIGIPLFYSVGFVLVMPLVFSISYQYKLPAVYIATPILAALSVAQGFLPPHPAPAALVIQFNASMGKTLLYGFAIAIPALIIGGPVFAATLKKIQSAPLKTFQAAHFPETELPGMLNSFISSLLPVFLLIITTLLPLIFASNSSIKNVLSFLADPSIVMLSTLIIATFTLGIMMKRSIKTLMNIYAEAVKDIAMILLVMGGAGALKQVLIDSRINDEIAGALLNIPIHPLVLAWLTSAVIRVCLGSATVAGLTTAGIIAPLIKQLNVEPSLMVLAIGAGSLMFSHVNDPAFWMYKEYLNLSFKDTIRSWSLMETTVAIVGLIGVLVINEII